MGNGGLRTADWGGATHRNNDDTRPLIGRRVRAPCGRDMCAEADRAHDHGRFDLRDLGRQKNGPLSGSARHHSSPRKIAVDQPQMRSVGAISVLPEASAVGQAACEDMGNKARSDSHAGDTFRRVVQVLTAPVWSSISRSGGGGRVGHLAPSGKVHRISSHVGVGRQPRNRYPFK